MVVREFSVSRRVETASGKKVKKTGTVRMNWASVKSLDQTGKRLKIAEKSEPDLALNDALAQCGGDGALFAFWHDYGKQSYARTVATNSITGMDAELKNKVRDFEGQVTATHTYVTEDLGVAQTREEIRATLLGKALYSDVKAYFASVEAGANVPLVIDYTAEFPLPKLWIGEEDEAEAEEEDEGEDNES